jgi:hypothetical protein
MKLESISRSDKPEKKLKATFIDSTGKIKTVHFGSKTSKTFLDTGDIGKRTNYIARHKVNENWNKPDSPGALSRFLLWGDSTNLSSNISQYKKRFGL